ncbi:MAG TPA: alpha/beta hydrolase [Candidatus Limnocylindrales bacterium]|nr:alpha/beta hydrolase [Candidatus Limnocylindrales bacterium]
MPYLEINGSSYYYAGDAKKSGIPVVFCHGSGGRHQHWIYQLKGLTENINPLVVDLPGHGRSAGFPADNITSYRDWLNNFCKALNLNSFVLAGHSMGGAIALDYALQYPAGIAGLVLVGTGGRLKVMPSFLETLREGIVPDSLVDFLYGTNAPASLIEKGRQQVASTSASIFLADLTACNQFDIMDRLPCIHQPVLLICGSEDRLTPLKYTHTLNERLPRSEVVEITGAGHMVMLEAPEAVNQAIVRFIANIAPQNH